MVCVLQLLKRVVQRALQRRRRGGRLRLRRRLARGSALRLARALPYLRRRGRRGGRALALRAAVARLLCGCWYTPGAALTLLALALLRGCCWCCCGSLALALVVLDLLPQPLRGCWWCCCGALALALALLRVLLLLLLRVLLPAAHDLRCRSR